MRHQKTRHKLSRTASHRKALLANLCKEVIQHERIKTSEAKAKAVKPEVEQLITLAKRGDLHARRQALSALGQDKFTVYKLFEEVAPRYGQRPGGYTRILKLGRRRSDATEMVLLELVWRGSRCAPPATLGSARCSCCAVTTPPAAGRTTSSRSASAPRRAPARARSCGRSRSTSRRT